MTVLPTIEHATVTTNQWGRVVVQMNDGYVFWDRADYYDYETGTFYDPAPEDIAYSRYGVFSPTRDFSTIVVVAESEVPENQIYGNVTPPAETV